MLAAKNIFSYIKMCSSDAIKSITQVRYLPKDIANAEKIGLRYSKINSHSSITTVLVTSTSVLKKGIKPHLPGLLASMGTLTPAPFASVAGFGAGKLLQKLI